MSMIPTSTGAAKAIGEVLPELKGKLDGISVRVPAPDGSLVDLVAEVRRSTTRDEINAAMKAAAEGPMKGILEFCTDPIVSVDVIGNPHSSVFDSLSTNVMGGNLVKLLSWYDNEWAFSQRVVDALLMMA
jgi:glyceraldehyde 3-phosphate dehydrogenase